MIKTTNKKKKWQKTNKQGAQAGKITDNALKMEAGLY